MLALSFQSSVSSPHYSSSCDCEFKAETIWCRYSMPYNTNNNIAYAVTMVSEIIILYMGNTTTLSILFLFVGSCMFFVAFATDVQASVNHFDAIVLRRSGKLTSTERMESKVYAVNAIRFYCETLRCEASSKDAVSIFN